MYKSYFDKYKRELEKEFGNKLDAIGEHISSEGTNYASGSYGASLQAFNFGNYANSFNHYKENNLLVKNGNSAEYSTWIEFGTGIHNPQGRKGGWKYQDAKGDWHFTLGMKPRPIQQTVIDSNDTEILDILSR
jgi:hypothetical protein